MAKKPSVERRRFNVPSHLPAVPPKATQVDAMTEEIVEGAKAVQETARATGKAIDGLRETGGFFNRVFGNLVEDGVGIVADKLKKC